MSSGQKVDSECARAAMTTMRRFQPEDMFRFNNVNLDRLTETYHVGFYLSYLSEWPDIFYLTETPSGKIMSYVMGKVGPGVVSFLFLSPRRKERVPSSGVVSCCFLLSNFSLSLFFLFPFVFAFQVEATQDAQPLHGHVTALTVSRVIASSTND